MQIRAKIDKVLKKFGYLKANEAAAIVSMALSGSTGLAPEKTYSQLVDAYKSWVYTSVDKIAKTVASLPLKLYVYRRKGQKILNPYSYHKELKFFNTEGEKKYYLKQQGLEKEEVIDHPWLDLINRPNSIMTRFMLWYETMLRLELGGLCAWYMVPNGLSLPAELWTLPLTKTAELKPVVSKKLTIEKWAYTDGEIQTSFKPEELIVIKYPHPKSPFDWYSPLMAQTYPYDIDLFLMQQQRALFENKAVFGNVFSTDQALVKTQIDQIKELINEQYAGATKSGKPLVLHSGLKLEKSKWSPKEAMIDEVSKYARQKLLSAYDLSDGKVGIIDDANRSNMEALDDTYIKECIKPKCMLIEEVIETFLLPIYDQGLTCDFVLPDIKDRELNIKERESNLRNYYTVINEERAKEGKDPVSWGDRPWMQFGMVQEGTFKPAEPKPKPAPKKEQETKELDEEWTEEKKRRKWEMFSHRAQKWENLITQQMVGYFRLQGEEIIKRLFKYGPRYEAQYAGWSKKAVRDHIAKKGIAEDININQEAEIAQLKLIFTPVLQSVIQNGGSDILKEMGLSFVFNINDGPVIKWLGSRMDLFSSEVTGTTFDDIKAILREGFSEGKPLSTIADTLREKFGTYEKYRAPLIARTETISSLNHSEILAIEQAGIEKDVLKHWLSARDEAVRATHREAEARYGKGIPIQDNFSVGGDSMNSPGNGTSAEENINCR
jgi:HK97 family phage portal protein